MVTRNTIDWRMAIKNPWYNPALSFPPFSLEAMDLVYSQRHVVVEVSRRSKVPYRNTSRKSEDIYVLIDHRPNRLISRVKIISAELVSYIFVFIYVCVCARAQICWVLALMHDLSWSNLNINKSHKSISSPHQLSWRWGRDILSQIKSRRPNIRNFL